MPRPYHRLDSDERRTILRLLNAKMPVVAIARQRGRHRSAIQHEIGRNDFPALPECAGCFPLLAQDRVRAPGQAASA